MATLYRLILLPGRFSLLLRRFYWRYFLKLKLKALGVNYCPRTVFYGSPIVYLAPGSSIEIGEGCVLCSTPEMTALGVNHPVVLRTLTSNARIRIGNNTGLSGVTICAAASVQIGNECLLGANVTIVDTDFHAINSTGRRFNSNWTKIGTLPTVIEDNVFIGAGSLILKGVRVGANSVIGAGSVVTRDIPPDSVVAGNPAKIVRTLSVSF